MARLYISQQRLNDWSSEERVSMEGDTMILAENGRSFTMSPAVRFLRVVDGENDPHNLIGTVSAEDALLEMGADHMANSVIYEDTAYEVECGFLGNPLPRVSGG